MNNGWNIFLRTEHSHVLLCFGATIHLKLHSFQVKNDMIVDVLTRVFGIRSI